MLPRQTMRIQHVHKRVRVELFEIEHTRLHPCAVEHQRCANHRRHAGGIADGLAADLGETRLMVANIVKIDAARLALMRAADNIADTGFPFVVLPKSPGLGSTAFKIAAAQSLAPDS